MKIGPLYLAHNFNDRLEIRQLELGLERDLGIELFNPFYDDSSRQEEMAFLDKRGTNDIARMKQLQSELFENRWNSDEDSSELLVRRDLTHLAAQKGLLTICKTPSFGTAIELCNAKLMCKPIYFVGEPYCNHPWIKVYATKRFKDLDEFKQYVIEENALHK